MKKVIKVCYKIQWQAWYKWEILYEMTGKDIYKYACKKIWQKITCFTLKFFVRAFEKMYLETDVFMLCCNVFQCMAMVLWIELFLFWDLMIKLFRYVLIKFLMMRGGESFLKKWDRRKWMNDDESMTKGYLYQCANADHLLKKEKEGEKEVLERDWM